MIVENFCQASKFEGLERGSERGSERGNGSAIPGHLQRRSLTRGNNFYKTCPSLFTNPPAVCLVEQFPNGRNEGLLLRLQHPRLEPEPLLLHLMNSGKHSACRVRACLDSSSLLPPPYAPVVPRLVSLSHCRLLASDVTRRPFILSTLSLETKRIIDLYPFKNTKIMWPQIQGEA